MDFSVTTRRLRCILRKCVRAILGKTIVFDRHGLQTLLAYRVSGEIVRDLNLPIPFEYERNSVIGEVLFYKGGFEEREIAAVCEILRRTAKPVVLDIGANVGWHSVRWAVGCPDSQIYAFEPAVGTAALLKTNALLNRVGARVKHVAYAVSDKEGIAEFHECEDSAYSSLKDTRRKKVISTTHVPVTTVDRFVEEEDITRLALIKIDVEGLETEVLRGSLKTLETLGPDVFVEIYGGEASNLNPEDTIRQMKSLGYEALVWKDEGLVPHVSHSDRYFNYLFSKKQ